MKKICENDYINFFKYPKVLWFMKLNEIQEFWNSDEENFLFEILKNDLFAVIDEDLNSKSLIFKNYLKIKETIDDLLLKFLFSKLKVEEKNFYNFSKTNECNINTIKKILNKFENSFIYAPKIQNQNYLLSPMAIYKYNGKIYLFNLSLTLNIKREIAGKFIFQEYIFKKIFDIQIDCYFLVYLKNTKNKVGNLEFLITSGIPFKSKKISAFNCEKNKSIIDHWKKLKNINSLFKKPTLLYDSSLYSKCMSEKEYKNINNSNWNKYDFDEENFWENIKTLKNFLKNQSREIKFNEIYNSFFINEKSSNFWISKNLITPDSSIFQSVLKKYFKNYNFSNKLIPFKELLTKLHYLNDKKKQENFLKFISKMKMFDVNEVKNKKYLVFEKSIEKFEEFNNKKIKIYYDFETLSLPISVLHKSKPYQQIVLQSSVIIDDNNKFSTINTILDPLTFQISDYKKIINSLYIEHESVAYVVYNKSFEINRLKEISELINDEEYWKKINFIIFNTVDLADWFIYNNNQHILVKNLMGFHSIKKVIKFIPKEFKTKINFSNYSELENCNNGQIAQNIIISRCLRGMEKEKIWKKSKEDLTKYCENDVKAMIITKMYIEKILKTNTYIYPLDLYEEKKKIFNLYCGKVN